jgi:hypothetical protein
MLDKALVKFPVGVPRRWEQITSYVRTRTQDEILFMVKVRPTQSTRGRVCSLTAGLQGRAGRALAAAGRSVTGGLQGREEHRVWRAGTPSCARRRAHSGLCATRASLHPR